MLIQSSTVLTGFTGVDLIKPSGGELEEIRLDVVLSCLFGYGAT